MLGVHSIQKNSVTFLFPLEMLPNKTIGLIFYSLAGSGAEHAAKNIYYIKRISGHMTTVVIVYNFVTAIFVLGIYGMGFEHNIISYV